MSDSRNLYLVVRASLWAEPIVRNFVIHADEHYQPLTNLDGGPVQVPEALFHTRAAAERERARRELAARELLNPFWLSWGELESLTSAEPGAFREEIARLGLTPPPPDPNAYGDGADWVAWWDAEAAGWTADQRADVWELLDKIRLFEVVEVEVGDE